jgi:hypothetical protein
MAHARTPTHTHAHVLTHTLSHTYTHNTHTRIHTQTLIHTNTHAHTHTHTHALTYIHTQRGGNRKMLRRKERDGVKAAKLEHQKARAASKKRALPQDFAGGQSQQPGPKRHQAGQQQQSATGKAGPQGANKHQQRTHAAALKVPSSNQPSRLPNQGSVPAVKKWHSKDGKWQQRLTSWMAPPNCVPFRFLPV